MTHCILPSTTPLQKFEKKNPLQKHPASVLLDSTRLERRDLHSPSSSRRVVHFELSLAGRTHGGGRTQRCRRARIPRGIHRCRPSCYHGHQCHEGGAPVAQHVAVVAAHVGRHRAQPRVDARVAHRSLDTTTPSRARGGARHRGRQGRGLRHRLQVRRRRVLVLCREGGYRNSPLGTSWLPMMLSFMCFRSVLQVFHLDVASVCFQVFKVFHLDVAYIVMKK